MWSPFLHDDWWPPRWTALLFWAVLPQNFKIEIGSFARHQNYALKQPQKLMLGNATMTSSSSSSLLLFNRLTSPNARRKQAFFSREMKISKMEQMVQDKKIIFSLRICKVFRPWGITFSQNFFPMTQASFCPLMNSLVFKNVLPESNESSGNFKIAIAKLKFASD